MWHGHTELSAGLGHSGPSSVAKWGFGPLMVVAGNRNSFGGWGSATAEAATNNKMDAIKDGQRTHIVAVNGWRRHDPDDGEDGP